MINPIKHAIILCFQANNIVLKVKLGYSIPAARSVSARLFIPSTSQKKASDPIETTEKRATVPVKNATLSGVKTLALDEFPVLPSIRQIACLLNTYKNVSINERKAIGGSPS